MWVDDYWNKNVAHDYAIEVFYITQSTDNLISCGLDCHMGNLDLGVWIRAADKEIFSDLIPSDGWYWHTAASKMAHPDSEPVGPFETEDEALEDIPPKRGTTQSRGTFA